MVELLPVILETIYALTGQMFFSNSLEHVFFDILIPKTKPISIGILYRPPNANNFFETFLIDLKKNNFNNNEFYILGDFNINLLQSNKFVLKENRSIDFW